MRVWPIVLVSSVALAFPLEAASEPLTVKGVKTRFSKNATDRRLVDKDADLIIDDAARRVTVRNQERPMQAGFDDIRKVVFDVSTHMRGGALGALVGGLAGAAIAGKHVNDYWCYIEYAGPDGAVVPYMIEIEKESAPAVIEKMQALFGDKVAVAEFPEKAEDIEKDTLKDLQSKHDLKVDEKNHPLPEPKADKALVVVVCPPLAARNAGKGVQFKLHANDQVVAVNKMGTYSFAYLDPGDYLLVSQTENASGFRMRLEAGGEYYLLQNTFMGMWKARTALSRNTKELVMYELAGSHHADWKRK